MPTNYSGSDLTYPANIPLPNDGEPAAAVFLSPAWQRLADRTAYLKSMADRERTAEVAITALPATLTVAQQLVYLNAAGGGFLTLPPPATAIGRWFTIRLPASLTGKSARLMPNAGELVNGSSGGFPLNLDGGHFVAFTPDGVNWIAMLSPTWLPRSIITGPATTTIEVFACVPSSGNTGTIVEIYGTGLSLVDDITVDGFNQATIGGSHVVHDDGRLTMTQGGGPGVIALQSYLVRDPDQIDYDETARPGDVSLFGLYTNTTV